MDMKQLQYFITVVDFDSFTKAAEALYISQSAVSQQIKLLEQELQVELLHRSHRHFQITRAGEFFYHQAKKRLADLEKMKIDTQRIGTKESYVMHIGYLKNYDGLALQHTIASFSSQYPKVELHLVNGNHEELYELLKTGKLDLVLNDQRRAFSDRYVNYQLAYCKCYIEVLAGHPFAKKQKISVEEIKDTACILIAAKAQRLAEREFYQEVLGIKSAFLFAENVKEARLLVAANRGYLLLEGKGQRADQTFVNIALEQNHKAMQRKYCAFWRKEESNVYIEEFAELLRTEFCKENEVSVL